MARLELIIVIVFIAFTVFALIDCIRTESSRVRVLPKILWALIVVVFSPIGGVLWFMLGKARQSRQPAPAYSNQVAPDDDPAFLRQLGEDKQRDQRIQDLEARLAELDDDQNNSKDK